jgi:hypothetical protein
MAPDGAGSRTGIGLLRGTGETTSAGYCAAGGEYSDRSENELPFVVSRT